MYSIAPGLAAELAKTSYEARTRITALWPDGTVRRVFDLGARLVTGGSATAERRRDVRRSATLTLVNRRAADGTFPLATAIAGDLFAQGSILAIESGALVDRVADYAPLITGPITVSSSSWPDATIDITVESYMSLLGQDAGTGFEFAAGTFLVDALHSLWDPVLPFITWVIGPGADSPALGATIPVLATDSRLDAGLKMARDLGCEAFDDRSGQLVVQVRPDPTKVPTARVMTRSLGLTRTAGRLPVNAQPVEVSPAASDPFFVLVEVTDETSPIHRRNIGLRVAPTIQSDAIPDPDTARATGLRWLAGRALSADQVTASELPSNLDLDEGDVVERTNAMIGVSGRFIIEGITVPLGPGSVDTTESQVAPLFLEDA